MFRIYIALPALSLLTAACASLPVAEDSSIHTSPTQIIAPIQSGMVPGMVSAADPRAAEAGAMILRQGGSAADAAIAVMLALTVVEPQSSGIGGGGFYVHADADGQVETLDGRETAPAAATPDWFLGPEGEPVGYREAVLSGLSIGVPGNIALAAEAHQQHGTLAWADLFQPAITLARDGWFISERFNQYLGRWRGRADLQPFAKSLYYDDAGEPLAVGTRLTNPELAATFQQIADEGPSAFYDGAHAAGLAAAINAATPRAGMQVADVTSYAAKWRDPVCGSYRQYKVCSMGPPSSGATTVLAMLGQLEPFDLAGLGQESPVAWHLFVESQRLAYADRELYLADSDFVPVPVAGLIDPGYLRQRSALIAQDSRMPEVSAGTPPGTQTAWSDGDEPLENGTSHFVVTDSLGNAVSYTSTIEGAFGSGYTFGGYFLNNELTDFSITPENDGVLVANRVEGGKRPRSSMSPTIVFGPDGHVRIAIGAAGGTTIPVQVTKALIGVLDWGMSAQDAIAMPIIYAPRGAVTLEEGSSLLSMQAPLEALGHEISTRNLPLKANAIEWRDGRWVGAADPRSEGVAIGE